MLKYTQNAMKKDYYKLMSIMSSFMLNTFYRENDNFPKNV